MSGRKVQPNYYIHAITPLHNPCCHIAGIPGVLLQCVFINVVPYLNECVLVHSRDCEVTQGKHSHDSWVGAIILKITFTIFQHIEN